MIIDNGTIEFKIKRSSEIVPETGYPAKVAAPEWSTAIPCQYIPVNRNYQVRIDGEHYTSAKYMVLVEMQPLPDAEQLRLTDRSGKDLGEYSLLSPLESLDAVCQIKLMI